LILEVGLLILPLLGGYILLVHIWIHYHLRIIFDELLLEEILRLLLGQKLIIHLLILGKELLFFVVKLILIGVAAELLLLLVLVELLGSIRRHSELLMRFGNQVHLLLWSLLMPDLLFGRNGLGNYNIRSL